MCGYICRTAEWQMPSGPTSSYSLLRSLKAFSLPPLLNPSFKHRCVPLEGTHYWHPHTLAAAANRPANLLLGTFGGGGCLLGIGTGGRCAKSLSFCEWPQYRRRLFVLVAAVGQCQIGYISYTFPPFSNEQGGSLVIRRQPKHPNLFKIKLQKIYYV
jgi:hypothetical protein